MPINRAAARRICKPTLEPKAPRWPPIRLMALFVSKIRAATAQTAPIAAIIIPATRRLIAIRTRPMMTAKKPDRPMIRIQNGKFGLPFSVVLDCAISDIPTIIILNQRMIPLVRLLPPPPAFKTSNRQKQAEYCHTEIQDQVPGIDYPSREIPVKVERYAEEKQNPIKNTSGVHIGPPDSRHDKSQTEEQGKKRRHHLTAHQAAEKKAQGQKHCARKSNSQIGCRHRPGINPNLESPQVQVEQDRQIGQSRQPHDDIKSK